MVSFGIHVIENTIYVILSHDDYSNIIMGYIIIACDSDNVINNNNNVIYT